MSLIIRNTLYRDIDGVRELQRRVYPNIRPWSLAQIEQHLKVFPAGQLVAVLDDTIVGSASSLIVMWDDFGVDHNWRGITGNGTFSTHNPARKTLYGAEVFVDPAIRRRGIGRSLYAGRRRICRDLNLRRIITAGRLPGYHRHAQAMSADMYAMKVIWGDIDDPVLSFQLRERFQFCRVIKDYLPEDAESCGYAALIVWLNPVYRATASEAAPIRA